MSSISAVLSALIQQKNKHILLINSSKQKQQPRNLDQKYAAHPLSHKMRPLNKFPVRVLYSFRDKEVVVIDTTRRPLVWPEQVHKQMHPCVLRCKSFCTAAEQCLSTPVICNCWFPKLHRLTVTHIYTNKYIQYRFRLKKLKAQTNPLLLTRVV